MLSTLVFNFMYQAETAFSLRPTTHLFVQTLNIPTNHQDLRSIRPCPEMKKKKNPAFYNYLSYHLVLFSIPVFRVSYSFQLFIKQLQYTCCTLGQTSSS